MTTVPPPTLPNATLKEAFAAESAKRPDVFRAWGGSEPFLVRLRADQEKYAAALNDKYGQSIRIRLGLFGYPLNSGEILSPSPCALLADTRTEESGLKASVTLSSAVINAGGDLRGTLTITNVGIEPVSFNGGEPRTGLIVRPGTTEVVGIYDGEIAGVGITATLAPGESKELEMLVGTASCDASVGFAVPPGDYEVITIAIDAAEDINGVKGVRLASAPTGLKITANPA